MTARGSSSRAHERDAETLREDLTSELRRHPWDVTLGISNLAALLGKDAATISNWRRRLADFPAPVTGGRSPKFALLAIDDWYTARPTTSPTGNESPIQSATPATLWNWSLLELRQATSTPDEAAEIRALLVATCLVSFHLAGSLAQPPLSEDRTDGHLPDTLTAYESRVAVLRYRGH